MPTSATARAPPPPLNAAFVLALLLAACSRPAPRCRVQHLPGGPIRECGRVLVRHPQVLPTLRSLNPKPFPLYTPYALNRKPYIIKSEPYTLYPIP
jgi:hypothetical protein